MFDRRAYQREYMRKYRATHKDYRDRERERKCKKPYSPQLEEFSTVANTLKGMPDDDKRN